MLADVSNSVGSDIGTLSLVVWRVVLEGLEQAGVADSGFIHITTAPSYFL